LISEGAVIAKAARATCVGDGADAIGEGCRIGTVIGSITPVSATRGCSNDLRPGKDQTLVDCVFFAFDA
jgi:hypothetical protein